MKTTKMFNKYKNNYKSIVFTIVLICIRSISNTNSEYFSSILNEYNENQLYDWYPIGKH